MTVSTVGIISKIRKLTEDLPEVSLALSLHAPNQAMRQAIVPTAKHYPIEQLIDALDNHMLSYLKRRSTSIKESTRRRAMIEYVMLEGPTSTFQAAHELGKLCQGRSLCVNLIPYNSTDVKDKLQCPDNDHLTEFRNIVISYGVFCTIRRTMGADIDSACGQLITLEKKETAGVVPDIEDVASRKLTPQKSVGVVGVVGGRDCNEQSTDDTRWDPWIRLLSIATTAAAASR